MENFFCCCGNNFASFTIEVFVIYKRNFRNWPVSYEVVFPKKFDQLYTRYNQLHFSKLWKSFLKDIDTLIRGCMKNISCLPSDTLNSMLYSERKYRGLGIVCADWEAYLQHINIAQKLGKIDDPLLQSCRDF